MTRAARARKLLRIPEPVIRFDLHPDSTGIYFQVRIYRTWRQLYRIHEHHFPKNSDHRVEGFVDIADRSVVNRLGVLCLCLPSVTFDNVAHEIFHCTIRWAEHMNMSAYYLRSWGTDTHEHAAEAHSRMIYQFQKQYDKLKGATCTKPK